MPVKNVFLSQLIKIDRKRGLRLLNRCEVLLPTLYGWLLVFGICVILIAITVYRIYPFLAVTSPVAGGDLVVEGWVSDYAFEQAIVEFNSHQYRKLYVTGGPIEQGASFCGYTNYADLGVATLRSKGLYGNVVQAVPAPHVEKDRTYASAIELKNWQRAHGIVPISYHVMTVGPHARRTRLMFEKAIGEGAIIGITAIRAGGYDPSGWWNSSAGVRSVINEAIAYIYARLLFRQPEQ